MMKYPVSQKLTSLNDYDIIKIADIFKISQTKQKNNAVV